MSFPYRLYIHTHPGWSDRGNVQAGKVWCITETGKSETKKRDVTKRIKQKDNERKGIGVY